jgi:outer membrane protein assembly factor BamE
VTSFPSPAPIARLSSATFRAVLLALVAALLAGCTVLQTYLPQPSSFGVYKLDINQGNYLSQDMVDRLRVGQTKAQVRLVLGTPLVTSPFHANRWDYVYEFKRQGQRLEHRTFAVYFVDDKLARWEGDEMPPSVMDLNRSAANRSLGYMPSAEDKGIFERVLDIFRSP